MKSTNCGAPHCAVFSSLVTLSFLGQNIVLSTLFSNTHNVCSSLNVSDQVSYPYKTTCTMIWDLRFSRRWRYWWCSSGLTSSLLLSPANALHWRLFGVSPLARLQSIPHSILIGPFLQTSLPATLYTPSDSHHGHFSPEDGDSTLLRKVGFYQPLHSAPKPRRTS
jgi:hypothetical protein